MESTPLQRLNTYIVERTIKYLFKEFGSPELPHSKETCDTIVLELRRIQEEIAYLQEAEIRKIIADVKAKKLKYILEDCFDANALTEAGICLTAKKYK